MKSSIRIYYAAACLVALLSIILSGCAIVPEDQRTDIIPMYGQPDIPRSEFHKISDSAFIKTAASGFGGDRKQASAAWADIAEQFFNEGNLHVAMRRYNQSWLLDPGNYMAFWGFGRIMLARRKYEESFKYFRKANALINDDYQKPALLHDTASAYHNKANNINKNLVQERKKYFNLANRYFEESTNADPAYPNSWATWAYSLYIQGNYQASWDKVKKARQLDASLITDEFLRDLRKELPEPNP